MTAEDEWDSSLFEMDASIDELKPDEMANDRIVTTYRNSLTVFVRMPDEARLVFNPSQDFYSLANSYMVALAAKEDHDSDFVVGWFNE
jgi:hypothetical protein